MTVNGRLDDGATRSRTRTRAFMAAAALLLIGAASSLPMWREHVSFSLDTKPSSRLLQRLAYDAGLSVGTAGKLAHTSVDGTMPDTADQAFRVDDAEAAKAALARACTTRHLHPPGLDVRQTTPAAICSGRWEGREATVQLFSSSCKQGCRLMLEVSVI